ncbi:site-2 protease family protein [Erythrobacter mangrovi]|uniref:Site-2 protease family protein n=1 Tax=Erythrobacter mangrovi TaxID=2739433 RepID=A0A7D3XKC9_9SPHN|nr:site-2 protease family protein [Erythrobacter mangrovi]QKG72539.1 site-2 protease family protein [Erythrobacter mangrovi]
MTETLLYAAILVPCLIVAIVFHEVAHGLAALALGDPTAREQRRLSFNPLRHVDPVGTLLVPGALALVGGPIFGWAKPVPVNARRLDNPRYGMMAVAAAGPGMNLLLALVGAVLLGTVAGIGFEPGSVFGSLAFTMLSTFVLINIFLALFNLLPIPPFDGSHIVGGLLPRSMAGQWQKLQQMGMLLLILLIAATWAFPNAGVVEHTVLPPVLWLQERYIDLAQWIANGIAG